MGKIVANPGVVNSLNNKIVQFSKSMSIADSGTSDMTISDKTGGATPSGVLVKLGNNYPLPYYSNDKMTVVELCSATTLRIRNNVSGWGTQTVHVTLFFE